MIIQHNTGEVSFDVVDGFPRVRYQTDSGHSWWKFLSLDQCIEASKFFVAAAEQFNKKVMHCGFCGKPQHEVRMLISGSSAYICNECVDHCRNVVDETRKFTERTP